MLIGIDVLCLDVDVITHISACRRNPLWWKRNILPKWYVEEFKNV